MYECICVYCTSPAVFVVAVVVATFTRQGIKQGINLGFGKLPTYPSPRPTFCHKSELSVNVDSGEG